MEFQAKKRIYNKIPLIITFILIVVFGLLGLVIISLLLILVPMRLIYSNMNRVKTIILDTDKIIIYTISGKIKLEAEYKNIKITETDYAFTVTDKIKNQSIIIPYKSWKHCYSVLLLNIYQNKNIEYKNNREGRNEISDLAEFITNVWGW